MSRLDNFCHWNPSDLTRVIKEFGGNPRFIHFYYGGGNDQIPGPDFTRKKNDNLHVWLGNSDTTSNNHLDAIEILKKYLGEKMMITCPLSYNSSEYGEFVAKAGTDTFGDKWTSIREMVPLNEYLRRQQEADVAVMYHNRSQASGNIIAFLKMGKKLYLKKESTIYELMMSRGIVVFDTAIIKTQTFEQFSAPLGTEQATTNSRLIDELFSAEGKIKGFRRILRGE
jgi:hypothetical protein